MRGAQYILILFFLVSTYCTGQGDYYTQWYSADNNYLPQNSVKSITPDKYGFIWLSTESGLIRYDGVNFKTFNSTNINKLDSDRMFVFGGDIEKDSISICNGTQQYLLVQKRRAKLYTPGVLPPLKPNRGQSKASIAFRQGLHYTRKNQIFRMLSDKTIYIIGRDTIRKYDSKYNLISKYFFPTTEKQQYFGVAGKLYLAGKDSTYIHITKTDTTQFSFTKLPENNYTVYTNETTKQVFIASGNNFYILKLKEGVLQPKLIYTSFSEEDNITSAYYNKNTQVLYLGSSNKGLIVIKKKFFNTMSSPLKMNRGVDKVYYGLVPYKNGEILASTGSIFKKGKYKYNIPVGVKNDKYAIITDDDENVWVKDFIHLYCYTKISGYKNYKHWELDNYITTMAKGTDGRIWIGTQDNSNSKKSGTLYVVNPKSENVEPQHYKSLQYRPTTISPYNENELWIGSQNNLIKLNINTNTITPISGFNNAYIRNILIEEIIDENNTVNKAIWIATYTKGIYLYLNEKITQFPTDKNEYILSAHCILEDKKGYFWISTNRGLFKAKKKNLLDYALGKCSNVYYHYYNKDYGFATNEFNGGCNPCGLYLKDTVYFPSMDGIVYFSPNEIPVEKPNNEIFIDEVQVDDRIFSSGNLNLNRKHNLIKFYITSPFYGNPINQNIETQLTGPVTQNWISLTNNYVAFSTLPPGNYTLTARKLTSFNSTYISKKINFTVTPAFWQTLWFKILIAITGVFMLLLLFKIRLRYIQYRNTLLERKVALQTAQLHNTISTLRKTKNNLSAQNESHKKLIRTIIHDIKTPLKFMAITGRYVYNSLDDNDGTLKEDVESIYTSSSQLYAFIDEFLEYSKQVDKNIPTPPFSLKELVNEKIDFFKALALHKNIELVNYIDVRTTVNVNKHLLAIIIHNLLDNALKNTQSGGNVIFNATSNHFKEVILSVKDNGKGMSKEQTEAYNNMILEAVSNKNQTIQSGMGLQIIVELLIIMDAKMIINSNEGIGTEVNITLR